MTPSEFSLLNLCIIAEQIFLGLNMHISKAVLLLSAHFMAKSIIYA
jgi:hypothetical protein